MRGDYECGDKGGPIDRSISDQQEISDLRAKISELEMVIANYLPACVGDCGCEGALAGCAILGDDPEATAIAEEIAARFAAEPAERGEGVTCPKCGRVTTVNHLKWAEGAGGKRHEVWDCPNGIKP